jgi:hypothetical protein
MGTDSDPDRKCHVPDATPTGEGNSEAASNEPFATLERAFIDEFLARRGYTLRSIDRLPPGDREPLLRAAAAHATLKLAEIEARAHLINEIEVKRSET